MYTCVNVVEFMYYPNLKRKKYIVYIIILAQNVAKTDLKLNLKNKNHEN